MTGRPVLQNAFEYRMWNVLDTGAFPKDGPATLVTELTEYRGTVNSAVLTMLIDAVAETADFETLEAIVSKSRATDCLPSVRACEIMLSRGDTESARKLLSMSDGSQEIVRRSMAYAELAMAEGNGSEACRYAGRAYGYDSGCREAYRILAMADPDGGWPMRENIQDVYEGRKPHNPHEEGSMGELFSIYRDWFSGRRDAATERLVGSRYYREKDPEFLLASARMSVDEKDWHSASMVYGELIGMDAPPFVRVEAAEAALGERNPTLAAELISGTDGSQLRVMRDIVAIRMTVGDTAEAMNALRSLLDSEFGGAEEHMNAVRYLLDREMESEALSVLDRYSRFFGEDSATLTIRSVLLMRSGDHLSALRTAKKAVRRDRKDNAARAQLARMLYLTDRTKAAEKQCSSILGKDETNPDALCLLRDIQMSSGEYADAVSTCRKLIETDPGDVKSLTAMGAALGFTGDRMGANDAFRRVVRSDTSRDAAVSAVSAMVMCGMYREAVDAVNDIERQIPGDSMLKRLKGNALYATGNYLEASAAYAEAVAADPRNHIVWHSKGMADEARGDLESAEDAYNRAILLNRNEPEYWISKAVVQNGAGDRQGAADSMDMAIALSPRSVSALLMKSSILTAMSRTAEALFCVRRAAEIDPDSVSVMDAEAEVRAATGDTEGAVNVLERRISVKRSPEACVRLAGLLASCGRDKDALAVMDEAMAEDPSPLLAGERERILSGEYKAPEQPSERRESARDNPATLAAMASSLLSAGDLKGAARNINRAIAADPRNVDLIALKAEIALASADADGALFLVEGAMKTHPSHPELRRVSAAAKDAKGDLKGALVDAENAIAAGGNSVELHMLKGRILEKSNQPAMAALSYGNAMALTNKPEPAEAFAKQKALAGDVRTAITAVSGVLRHNPRRVSALILKAELCRKAGDVSGMTEACVALSDCKNVPPDVRIRAVRLLEGAGKKDEAKALMEDRKSIGNTGIQRYAEKVLRRACVTGTGADDPDILDALGFDSRTAALVTRYLSEIPSGGPVSPESEELFLMERLSHDAIVSMNWKEIESNPDLPLEKVFVQGHCKDADTAKAIVSYVKRAMDSPLPETADKNLERMSMSLPRGISLFDVIKQCNLGVYEARIVQSLIV